MSIENRGIQPGDEVYTADDQHIGAVREAQAAYLHVEHGRLFGQNEYYFPAWTVGRVVDGKVYLSFGEAELAGLDWSTIPQPGETRASRFGAAATSTTIATGNIADLTEAETLDQHEVVVPIVEERLDITKRPVELGAVVINRQISEQERTIPVEATYEEVRVERRATNREATPEDLRLNAGAGLANLETGVPVIVPLLEEIVEVHKRLMVREELVVTKLRVSEQREVTETTRRSAPVVAPTGQLEPVGEAGATPGSAALPAPAEAGQPTEAETPMPTREPAEATVRDQAEVVVPLVEERMDITKRPVELGAVMINRETVEQQQTVPVEVAHEEVRVERRVVDREATPADLLLAGGEGLDRLAGGETLIIPVIEEIVDVRKRMLVREELVITKERRSEHHEVTETARRVEVSLAAAGDLEREVTTAGSAAAEASATRAAGAVAADRGTMPEGAS